MPQMNKTSVQLLFPPEVAAALILLSQQISGVAHSAFILGPQTPPHITLFSFTGAGEENIRIAPKMCPVSFTGLCELGDQSRRVWIALGVKKTEEIIRLRGELITALGNPQLTYDAFEPHVTLGNIAGADYAKIHAALSTGNNSLLQMENIPCMTAKHVSA